MDGTWVAEWKRDRRDGIGGSEAASVLGEGRYACARRVYYDKVDPIDLRETPQMKRGTSLEPLVVERYRKETGRLIVDARNPYIHPKYSFLRGNIDAIVTDVPGKDGDGVLECKTMGERSFDYALKNGLPEQYILQMQHYMFVSELKWGSFAVLHPDSWTFEHWDVERNETLMSRIEFEAKRFWTYHVKKHVPPDRLMPDAPPCFGCQYFERCHPTATRPLEKPPSRAEIELERVPELGPALNAWREAQVLKAQADEASASAREMLMDAMGDRLGGSCDGMKVYRRKVVTERIDTRRLKVRMPEIAKQFSKVTEYTRIDVV